MKKIFLPIVICLLFAANVARAQGYDSDPNYLYVFTGSGQSTYLDLRTVSAQEYNPPRYTIRATIVLESGWSPNATRKSVTLKYNYSTKECFSLENGYWQEMHLSGDSNSARFNRALANALFQAAYGMRFV